MSEILSLLGRICIAMIFVVAGFNNFMDFSGTVAFFSSEGLPFAKILAIFGIGAEIVGGLMVLLGFRARFGAFILFLFTLPTTFVFYDFWTLESTAAINHMQHFMKNFAMMGGLLYIMAYGAGSISVDGLTKSDSK